MVYSTLSGNQYVHKEETSAKSVSRNTVDRRRIRDGVQVLQASCLQILAHSYYIVLIGNANGQMVARI